MIASLQWLQECYPFQKPMSELTDGLTMLGIEVESIHDEGDKYKGFVTGKVLGKEAHSNADSLSVCMVNTGASESVIICGAPNVDAGQTVIVAQEGALIPNGGFTIGKRKIRGIESNGMICSKHELNIGEDDGGIWVLPQDTPIGMPLKEFLGTDILLEIGITPNRADCLSHIGLAREIACLEGNAEAVRFPGKAEALSLYSTHRNEGNPSITIQDSDLCHRYVGLCVKGITNGESPEWLQKRLESIGLRSKNIVVDVSNYVLHETGQPLHTFDADLIAGNSIIVKRANNKQTYETLDGKVRTLDNEMLLICDAEKPIAIAGVMGGKNSEISELTTSVFIESAYFQPSSIRRTAKVLGISSDAAYRFERGVDINMLEHAACRAAQLIIELAGGYIAEAMSDEFPNKHELATITLRIKHASKLLGFKLDGKTAEKCLRTIGCNIIDVSNDEVVLTAPSWRIDIKEEIDVIEEVARIIGYDNLPMNTDVRFPGEAKVDSSLKQHSLRNSIRKQLTSMGLQEIVTYSLMDAEKALKYTDNPVRLVNPLGEEYSVMRPSLIPASLQVIARNWNAGQRGIAMFDIGRVFLRDASVKDSIVTLEGYREREHAVIILAGSNSEHHWKHKNRPFDFYDAKGLAEAMLKFARVSDYSVTRSIPPSLANESMMSSNAVAFTSYGNTAICAGQLLPSYCAEFNCTMPVFAIIIDLTLFYELKKYELFYKPISVFPAVYRDLAFIVEKDLPVQSIIQTARAKGGDFLREITVFDVFEGKSIGDGNVSVGLRFMFQSNDKTLIEDEINAATKKIISAVKVSHNAILRDM